MIWLIGGTSESISIAKLLWESSIEFIVSVTTTSARQLYPFLSLSQIIVGKLSSSAIEALITEYQIKTIIDASHPFAVNISQSVMTICHNLSIVYVRYERPIINHDSMVTYVDSIDSLLTENSLLAQKRVLLTIGAKFLPLFADYHQFATLYARILPYPESINLAYEANFTNDRLIALRPPISYDLEKALWQLWNIEIVVTKAGGKAGGEEIKYQVAQELNIPLVLIERPKLDYPFIISTLDELSLYLGLKSQ